MKTLLVFAHPITEGSFNHALKKVAQSQLRDLKISDLYGMQFKAAADWDDFQGEGFSPHYAVAQKEAYLQDAFTKDIKQEQERLLWCDLLILQFPLWWFNAPAILKGWMDRVLAKGFAYDKGQWFEQGLLKGKKAMLVLTTQSSESSYAPKGVHGPIEEYLKPLEHTLNFVGISLEAPFVAYGVDDAPDALKQEYLERYRNILAQLAEK